MSLSHQILAVLCARPDGEPMAVSALADKLQCPQHEILAVATTLQQREPGDRELISIVARACSDGTDECYLSRVALPMNDEPEAQRPA